MAIERYGSKTDVVVKLVLVFFVCLLSFSVGTFVGKKFSDNQHRLAQFEPASAERQVASTEGTKTTPKAGETLSDEEIAKLAEEFVNDDESGHATAKNDHADHTTGVAATNAHAAPAATADDPHAAPAAKAQTPAPTAHGAAVAKTAIANPHAAPAKTETKHIERNVAESKAEPVKPLPIAEKVAQGQNPKVGAAAAPAKAATTGHGEAAAQEKKPIPTSLPQDVAASAVGKYTVQVASYPSETEATKMTDTLKGQGFGAFYIKADIVDKKTAATKTWYRVSVGLFQTQKEADAYKADLLSRSKVTSAIVQKVTK